VKEPGLQPDFIEVHHARDGIGLVGLNGKIKTESATTAETDQGAALAPRLGISSISPHQSISLNVPADKRIS
jgi:hypothetical protein